MMETTPVRILLVEDNPGQARLMLEMLRDAARKQFILLHVHYLEEGIRLAEQNPCDVVLLDLQLPDSEGLETVTRFHERMPSMPIVVVTGSCDEDMGIEALRLGAQDYLLKGKADGNMLARSVQFAMERQRVHEKMRVRSFVDELTGLYNRRGFLTLAEQQIQTASREERGLMLLFIDIDRMKHINDHFGHKAGDMAIKDTADVLRQTFRGTDIKARLGGDEFAVLAPEVHPARASALVARLQRNLQKHNARQKRGYDLSLSVGFARYDHYLPKSLTELMDQADRTMYADKRQEEQACAA